MIAQIQTSAMSPEALLSGTCSRRAALPDAPIAVPLRRFARVTAHRPRNGPLWPDTPATLNPPNLSLSPCKSEKDEV